MGIIWVAAIFGILFFVSREESKDEIKTTPEPKSKQIVLFKNLSPEGRGRAYKDYLGKGHVGSFSDFQIIMLDKPFYDDGSTIGDK